MEYLEYLESADGRQFCYRQPSANLATTLLLYSIKMQVDKGLLVEATFIDVSKAFDTISLHYWQILSYFVIKSCKSSSFFFHHLMSITLIITFFSPKNFHEVVKWKFNPWKVLFDKRNLITLFWCILYLFEKCDLSLKFVSPKV